MWKTETYQAISQEFGTAIGVATAVTVSDVRVDPKIAESAGRERYRLLTDEIRVNRIISDAVRIGRYREVTRRQFWLRKANPKWTERRAWAAAWREVAGRKPKVR